MKNVTFQGLLALTLLMAVAVSNSAHACSVALVPTVCQGGSPLDFVGTGDSVAIQTFGYVASNGAKKACSAAEFQVLLGISLEPPPEGPQRPCGKRENRIAPREDMGKWLSVRIKPVNLLRPEVTGRLKDRSKGGLGLISMAALQGELHQVQRQVGVRNARA